MKKLPMILPLVFLLCFTFSCQKAEEENKALVADGLRRDGNYVEDWGNWDELGLVQQLGMELKPKERLNLN